MPIFLALLFATACGLDETGEDTIPDVSELSTVDIACLDEVLGEDEATPFTVAHKVENGELGERCFGDADQRLVDAWSLLASITPPGQLRDLGLFGGFEVAGDEDETTLAFVHPLDDDGTIFQMSLNLNAGDEDPNEFALTLAHEFSHVFTSVSTEIDRFAEPDDCETYFNGDGCFYDDALMTEWIELFWSEQIDDIDPNEEPSNADGEQRCNLDPSFLGPYAASNPEEDFAESFSAFVFALEVDTPELQAKMDWFAGLPGLAEFRTLADESGLSPLQNNFEPCG